MLISDLGRLCHRHPEFRFEQRIPTVILSTANGIVLLAQLYMKSFKVKLNAVEVEDALKNLPMGYDYTYESTMERINAISTANPNDISLRENVPSGTGMEKNTMSVFPRELKQTGTG